MSKDIIEQNGAIMKNFLCGIFAILFLTFAVFAQDANTQKKPHNKPDSLNIKPEEVTTEGSVTVEGQKINYKAVSGTIILKNDKEEPTCSMFYVAYFKKGAVDESHRPVTFFYNGGPGSSSMWLHMGAFGPKRVYSDDDKYPDPAPYKLVNNDYSLLDATDMVFIDAPATGFSRIVGKGKGKDFFGVDGDANAFSQFITRFITKFNRWNSPKYLFGESYGTTRSAVLSNILQRRDDISLNGVILLSEILNFDTSPDGPSSNPGVDLGYSLSLPTMAATAWYHKKLPNQPKALEPFLKDVEHFAVTDYTLALMKGSELGEQEKESIAEKLHEYTGLSKDYILKSNLRITGGQFRKELQDDSDLTTGRLDTRFSGTTMDPLSESAEYDPQSAAISSAYVTLFNTYVREDLKFGKNQTYRPTAYQFTRPWDDKHRLPGRGSSPNSNVMQDLAMAMKYNPHLKIMLNSGYFDLATPFYAAVYTMHHLPIPDDLQKNIEYYFYMSGHMVYVHPESLKKIHDNTAEFINKTHS